MAWGIIGALDKEVYLIKKQMTVRDTVDLFGSACSIGTYKGQEIIVTCSGIGKVNAAACASAMIREFKADRLVNIGIAGNMSKRLGVLDMAISQEVVFHDVDLSLFSRYYPFKRSFAADKNLVEACIGALDGMEGRAFSYEVGTIATGDIFVNDKSVKEDIINRLNPICVEMEGAAVGQAAYMNGVPFLVIRTMSDSADDNADSSYDNFIDLAAENSARVALNLIERFESGHSSGIL